VLPDVQTASSRVPDNAVDPGTDSPNPLYAEFCRQLQNNLATGEVKRMDLMKSLDLVPSQINKWLKQAEREGWLRRTCKSPAKYALIKGQQSLL
jgi:type II secretory pathway component PulF